MSVSSARGDSAALQARKGWRAARSFQERVQQALASQRVLFIEWLILQTAQDLIQQTGDAISQSDLAQVAGLSRGVVSYWMIDLSERGLVDRGPHPYRQAWRVILTASGLGTLQSCNERLEAAGLTE